LFDAKESELKAINTNADKTNFLNIFPPKIKKPAIQMEMPEIFIIKLVFTATRKHRSP
jgi:hypothetical protein